MLPAADLMAATCICAPLASKLENAIAIKNPIVVRVQSVRRTASCFSNNNAEIAAAVNSQKNRLTRFLCNFNLFWRFIKPTPFCCLDGGFECRYFRALSTPSFPSVVHSLVVAISGAIFHRGYLLTPSNLTPPDASRQEYLPPIDS